MGLWNRILLETAALVERLRIAPLLIEKKINRMGKKKKLFFCCEEEEKKKKVRERS